MCAGELVTLRLRLRTATPGGWPYCGVPALAEMSMDGRGVGAGELVTPYGYGYGYYTYY